MKSFIASSIFAGVMAFSGYANATTVDFTTAGWLGASPQSQTIGGIDVTVSIFSAPVGSFLNADGVAALGSDPCVAPLSLVCAFDGIGISQVGGSDDEVTLGVDPQEVLRVTFDNTAVNITDIGFLDLFNQPNEPVETASWTSNGLGADAAGSANSLGAPNGWVLASLLDINGVTQIDFFASGNPNSDFALAYLEVQAIPIPAALPLFGSVLGLLGLLGWRRKRMAAV